MNNQELQPDLSKIKDAVIIEFPLPKPMLEIINRGIKTTPAVELVVEHRDGNTTRIRVPVNAIEITIREED